MDDIVTMQVSNRTGHLRKKNGCHFFIEVAHLDNFVEQLSASAKLHHKIDVPMILESLIQLHNAWMVDLLQYLDLPGETFRVSDSLFGDNFHRKFFMV